MLAGMRKSLLFVVFFILSTSITAGISQIKHTFKVINIEEGKIIINGGAKNNIESGDNGRIYYAKSKDFPRYFIAEFIVEKTLNRNKSVAKIIEKREEVKVGYFVLFDSKGSIIIKSNPDDAAIFINGNYKGKTNSILVLPQGKYRVKIYKENYKEVVISNLNIQAGKIISRIYNLSPLPVKIFVDSKPQGAEIYLDEETNLAGITPCELNVSPGPHKIILRKEDFQEKIANLTIEPGQSINELKEIYSLIPFPGKLYIDSKPQGAEIYLDEETNLAGITPRELNVSPGPHKIILRKEGFQEKIANLTIEPGQSVRAVYDLSPSQYKLKINSIPQFARVFINNEMMGTTPLEIKLNNPRVKIKIEKEEYKSVEETFILTESFISKTIHLEKLKKAKISITWVPPQANKIEIDGKPYDLPKKQPFKISIPLGNYKIVCFSSKYPKFERELSLKEEKGEYNINFNFEEEFPRYEITAYPLNIKIAVDGKFEKFPPMIIKYVKEGTHNIKYIVSELAEIEIIDEIYKSKNKKIHINSENVNEQNLKDLYLNKNKLENLKNDLLLIMSNNKLTIDIDRVYQAEASSSKMLSFQLMPKKRHEIKLIIREPKKNYEIKIFSFQEKRWLKYTITTEKI